MTGEEFAQLYVAILWVTIGAGVFGVLVGAQIVDLVRWYFDARRRRARILRRRAKAGAA